MKRIKELERENDVLRKNAQVGGGAAPFGTETGTTAYWKDSYNQQIPSGIMRQLDELKRENDLLRKDTIHLLQKQSSY